MLEQNKLERLYFASLFRLVYYLRVRPEPTRVEHLTVQLFKVKLWALDASIRLV
jgi:hypothetical protein